MARVVLRNVWKCFGAQTAAREVNLEIEDGEFGVMVGPSGCGKTTVLRMIAGLETLSEGEIWIGDRLINNVRPADRDIAMVFQSYALYPHMHARDNMSFGMRLRKMAESLISDRIGNAANILSIGQLMERKPNQMSGGQRQRVALGRAIVREPAAFLMDEPLSNLDAKLRVQMRAELSKLHRRLGTTTIYVTHDQTEAMTMGDKIVVMKDGRVQQVGRPEEVYHRPANKFVAEFVGTPSMNFFPAVLREESGSLLADTGPFRVRVPDRLAAVARKQRSPQVLLGIRPEDIFDPRFRTVESDALSVTGELEVREAMGPETYVHVACGSHTFVARVDARCGSRVGEQVHLSIDTAKIHLFDAETEGAIA